MRIIALMGLALLVACSGDSMMGDVQQHTCNFAQTGEADLKEMHYDAHYGPDNGQPNWVMEFYTLYIYQHHATNPTALVTDSTACKPFTLFYWAPDTASNTSGSRVRALADGISTWIRDYSTGHVVITN
jgi:hypothetical protein